MREDDDVVLRAETALAQLRRAEVSVGHLEGVERQAYPAFILCARPCVDVANARDVEVVLAANDLVSLEPDADLDEMLLEVAKFDP